MGKKMFLKTYGKDVSLKMTIDTNLGSGTTFSFPTIGTNLYDVDWGDGSVDYAETSHSSHTYATDGIYQISITGTLDNLYMYGSSDKTKLVSIDQWGNVGYGTTTSQPNSFRECKNLRNLAEDIGWINSLTNGFYMFYNCSNLNITGSLNLNSLTNGNNMFRNCSSLELNGSLNLNSLTNGSYMFMGCLNLNITGSLNLNNLTDGSNMFYNCSSLELNGSLNLNSLMNGYMMFRFCSNLNITGSLNLNNLTNGSYMFQLCLINTNVYSQLLIDLENLNPKNSVVFHGGNSKYNTTGQIARNILTTAPRNWTITDGGLL